MQTIAIVKQNQQKVESDEWHRKEHEECYYKWYPYREVNALSSTCCLQKFILNALKAEMFFRAIIHCNRGWKPRLNLIFPKQTYVAQSINHRKNQNAVFDKSLPSDESQAKVNVWCKWIESQGALLQHITRRCKA